MSCLPSPPPHVMPQRLQNLALKVVLHKRVEIVPRKLPRCRISRRILRIEGIGCRVAHIARLRTSNQPPRIGWLTPVAVKSAVEETSNRHETVSCRGCTFHTRASSAEIRRQNAEVR